MSDPIRLVTAPNPIEGLTYLVTTPNEGLHVATCTEQQAKTYLASGYTVVEQRPEPARDVAAELREEIAALKQENARLRAGLAHHDAGIEKARRSVDDARGFLLEAGGALVAIGLRHEEQAAEIPMLDREELGRMAQVASWGKSKPPPWGSTSEVARADYIRIGEAVFRAGMSHVLKIQEGR
jgi:hypothetical protein